MFQRQDALHGSLPEGCLSHQESLPVILQGSGEYLGGAGRSPVDQDHGGIKAAALVRTAAFFPSMDRLPGGVPVSDQEQGPIAKKRGHLQRLI